MTLEPRIAGALSLAPMTVAQLARCLSANVQAVRRRLDAMPAVMRCGTLRGAGRPFVVYGIANGR